MKLRYAVILVLGAALTFLAAPAHADAIDGHWCHKDGRRMSVDGPVIVTPGGASMEGEYERHSFAYVAPEGEPGAGSRIVMALQSDDVMQMFIPGKGPLTALPTVETWQRCDLTM